MGAGCNYCKYAFHQEEEIVSSKEPQPKLNLSVDEKNENLTKLHNSKILVNNNSKGDLNERNEKNDKTELTPNNINETNSNNSAHDVNNILEEFEINFHDHAINIFHIINKIRTEPEKFTIKLESILSRIKKTKDGDLFIELENCTYKFLHSDDQIQTSIQFLKSIANLKENKSLLWSENIYQSCIEYLNFDEKDEKILYQRIDKNCNQKVRCLEISQDGLMTPETTVLIMLIDQIELREILFCRFFDFGAACCSTINSEMKVRTIVVLALIIDKNIKEYKEINGNKESNHNGVKNGKITLDHPAFNKINYKHLIVSQNIIVENNIVIAKFELSNGELKEERIKL